MIILHISNLSNNQASGIRRVVPEHVHYQGKYAQTALLNLTNSKIDLNSNKIVLFTKKNLHNYDVTTLPQPFNNPDLVVVHGIYFKNYFPLVKKMNAKKIPYILVPHGSLTVHAQAIKPIKKKVGNIFFNRIINNAAAIQYLSKQELETSINKGLYDFVGCNGISIEDKHHNEFNSKEGLKIIYIGRLDPYHKGLDILIDGCNCVKNELRSKNIKVSLIGPDHEGGKNRLQNMIDKYSIDDIISIENGLFGDEKIARILSSDLFIQTSRFEGQPLGILEALSLGLPVIATPGTNMADEIEENNCGIKTELDSCEIGNAILKAFSRKCELKTMSNDAMNFIRNNYTWEKVSKVTIEKYKFTIKSINKSLL